MREIAKPELVAQLRALGVRAGGVLVVHTSFRAVRPIEGGPAGLLDALRTALGADGTLVMPSWTGDDSVPFDPATTPAAEDLGVVADTFWRLPGVVRSPHAFAFAAQGPLADEITRGSLPRPPHAPGSPIDHVRRHDGQVLLLGVNHDSDTTIHLAELLAGVPYGVPKHVTDLVDGRPVRVEYVENDHCCQRFALVDDWLVERGRQAEGTVGHASARLCRAQDVVDVAMAGLARDPLVFLHSAADRCEECDLARASVRGSSAGPRR